jgi:hypothetical protein
MHEEEHDQRSFDGGYKQRNDRIEGTEIHEGYGGRRYGQDEQSDTDKYVKSLRVSRVLFVFRHGNPLDQFSVPGSQFSGLSVMSAD